MSLKKSNYDVLCSYDGEGCLEFEDGKFEVSFQVAQLANGRIVCECTGGLELIRVWQENSRLNRLIGLSGNFEIVAERLTPVSFSAFSSSGKCSLEIAIGEVTVRLLDIDSQLQPQSTSFFLTNFEFLGFENYFDSLACKDKLKLHWILKGYDITIQHLVNYEEKVRSIKASGGIDVTAVAQVSATDDFFNISDIVNIVGDLCLMLTLARGCGIEWIYRETFVGKQVVERYHWNPIILPYTMYDLIPLNPPGDLKYFVEHCFEVFQAEKEIWQLRKAIHMYVGAKTLDFLENKALKIAVLLDFLRSIYLKMRNKTYLIDRGVFNGSLKLLKKQVAELLPNLFPEISEERLKLMVNHIQGFNWYPLRRATKEMYKELGLEVSSKKIDEIVKQRNELAHRGGFVLRKNTLQDEPEQIFREMMTLAGMMILAILQYDGWYYDWTKPPGSVMNSDMRVKMSLIEPDGG